MLYIHGFKFQEETILSFNDYRLKYLNNWSVIENDTLDNQQETTRVNEGNDMALADNLF